MAGDRPADVRVEAGLGQLGGGHGAVQDLFGTPRRDRPYFETVACGGRQRLRIRELPAVVVQQAGDRGRFGRSAEAPRQLGGLGRHAMRVLAPLLRKAPGDEPLSLCAVDHARPYRPCLLYTSDAADDLTRVDL